MDPLKEFCVFSGTSHPSLAKQIADCLGVKLGEIDLGTFPDGEIHAQILENVRGRSVFVVQSIAGKPNYFLMELLIVIDALKRASAQNITAVLPYYGYSRQDRKDRPRVAITAKLVADLLESAGATRVLTMDLHAGQLQGFFNVPLDNLSARPILLEACRQLSVEQSVVVAPDTGSLKMAREFAEQLGSDLAVVDKRRISATEVESMHIIGNVAQRTVFLVDDICSTAGTLVKAAEACRKAGAKEIYAFTTHGLCVSGAVKKVESSPIKKVFVSNTIPDSEQINSERFETISVAKIFSRAIQCINSDSSITSLFREDGKELMFDAETVLTH
jgi:ribose-phosphate pyrophosphokinase